MVSAVLRHTVSREIAVRRADRLFQIIQVLRRSTQPVTASQLGVELEVSQRSVYRDVADLIGQRVPIRGEAGIGYVLDRDFDMPPLMLTPDELEAAVLGAQWVADRGDAVLASAARDLISKIAAAVPERLRPFIAEPTIGAPPANARAPDGLDIARTRLWIRSGRKIRIRYRNRETHHTAVIRFSFAVLPVPVDVLLHSPVGERTTQAWCFEATPDHCRSRSSYAANTP